MILLFEFLMILLMWFLDFFVDKFLLRVVFFCIGIGFIFFLFLVLMKIMCFFGLGFGGGGDLFWLLVLYGMSRFLCKVFV